MQLSDYIQETILRPRLKQSGCLVVYDAERRYLELCRGMQSDRIAFVDASESSIESREAAIFMLQEISRRNAQFEGLVVYVPSRKPETDEQRQVDPFALYIECGSVFPKNDGEEYFSLCLRSKPDHATAIRKVFAETSGAPSFAVIDAIGGGTSWPQLRSLLRMESAREILTALLVPTEKQIQSLKAQDGWLQEARDFLQATLSMPLKTRGKTWNALADELWRYVLFSEFVFDLPIKIPEVLDRVPCAPVEAKPIVEDVCDRLRTDPRTIATYIERAEAIEADLNLPAACIGIEDLGERDTFPFEERTFLRMALKSLAANDTDTTRKLLIHRRNSVWMGRGDSQAQWVLVRAGLNLMEACDDLERQLPTNSRSQQELLNFYVGSLREADRLQREFEQTLGDFLDQDGLMNDVILRSRGCYSRLAEKVQTIFIKHVEIAGWPPPDRLHNTEIFDRLVSVRIQENGRKVAYIKVDALRYELGVALEKLLSEDIPVELQVAYAQLPSITLVGMASLLPGAKNGLTLTLDKEQLSPKLAGIPVSNVSQRMDAMRKKFGDRFSEMLLNDFVRSKPEIADTVDLLVLRSTEIDSQLESNPETTLGLIPGTLRLIRVALHRLKGMGFKEAIIVTDHGFFLNAHAEAGDVCTKPVGNWPINAHDRMMLGSGSSDSHNLVMSAEKLGIHGDFAQVALPRSMAPYRAGHLYFHGGLSLAEAVVPVLLAKLDVVSQPSVGVIAVKISYKNGAKKITTRIPVIEIVLESNLFSHGKSLEVLLEAQDSKDNVVGEPRPSTDVNPATRTVSLIPGEAKQIAMRMDPDYEGKFSIKALNPTTLAAYTAIKLETDYTV